MSLDDLKRKVDESGTKTYTDQHGRILREGQAHEELVKSQAEAQQVKAMKSLQKDIKQIKSSGGLHGLGH